MTQRLEIIPYLSMGEQVRLLEIAESGRSEEVRRHALRILNQFGSLVTIPAPSNAPTDHQSDVSKPTEAVVPKIDPRELARKLGLGQHDDGAA